MSDTSFIDTQPPGSHTDPEVSLAGYTYERLLEYWTMIYTLGLLGGVVGTEEEQTNARDAVLAVLSDVAEASVGYVETAEIAIDDNTLPGLGLGSKLFGLASLRAQRGIEDFFGFNTRDNDAAIATQEKRIRDSVAVDINQVARISQTAKVVAAGVANNTPLPDYNPDLTGEQQVIAATQDIVDQRNAQVRKMLSDMWTAIKDVALSRFNRFMDEWDQHGLGYAYGTLAIDGAFLAIEIAISAAAGAVTGGAAAVALKVAVDVGRRVTKAATRRVIKVIIKNASRLDGPSGEFNVPKSSVDDLARSKNGYGDDLAGNRNSTHVNERDAGGPDDGNNSSTNNIDKQDVDSDGNYRNPNDPEGVRRTPDGEVMIQNKEGTWRPVSEMADPDRPEGDSGRRHNPQVGRWGEVQADRYAADQGWEKINGPNTTMDSPFTGPQRIDAVYRDPGPPERLIVSDAKALGSKQGKTKDGLQMSSEWIENRLERSGLSQDDIDDIMLDREQVLLKVDKNGNVTEEWLDDAGEVIPAPAWRTP